MTLCRAFVSLPDHLCEPVRPGQERVVFFEFDGFSRTLMFQHLGRLLETVWGVPTEKTLDEGYAYNVSTERELLTEFAFGGKATGDLQLLETGSGGEITFGVIPPGAADPRIAIHYARAADVDLFVTPRTAARLQKALAQVEALYAAKGGAS